MKRATNGGGFKDAGDGLRAVAATEVGRRRHCGGGSGLGCRSLSLSLSNLNCKRLFEMKKEVELSSFKEGSNGIFSRMSCSDGISDEIFRQTYIFFKKNLLNSSQILSTLTRASDG